MPNEIRRYPVRHPLLKNYIKFFWELRIDHIHLNHKLIPQRNINLRFNLSETPQLVCLNANEHLLENVYFSGLQDHFTNAHLKLTGEVHMLGVCFFPEGFYPFLKIPVSLFKNKVLGAAEVGFWQANIISEKLKEATDVSARMNILEEELSMLLIQNGDTPEKFRQIFNALNNNGYSWPIEEFCKRNNMGMRKLERMYTKYVGVSANTYGSLNRFHNSLNRLLIKDFTKLSDLAYDHGYYDQMHFIKDFKRFAGDTPKSFIHQNNSILQIGKLE